MDVLDCVRLCLERIVRELVILASDHIAERVFVERSEGVVATGECYALCCGLAGTDAARWDDQRVFAVLADLECWLLDDHLWEDQIRDDIAV